MDGKVAQLEAENVSLRAELSAACGLIAERDAELVELRVRVDEQDAKIGELLARLG